MNEQKQHDIVMNISKLMVEITATQAVLNSKMEDWLDIINNLVGDIFGLPKADIDLLNAHLNELTKKYPLTQQENKKSC